MNPYYSDDDSDNEPHDPEERQAMLLARTGLTLMGARDMPDGPLKDQILPTITKLFSRLCAPRCKHCSAAEPGHYYDCRLAQKCSTCGARTDLPSEPHPQPCPQRHEIARRRKERELHALQEQRQRDFMNTRTTRPAITLGDYLVTKSSGNRKNRNNRKKLKI